MKNEEYALTTIGCDNYDVSGVMQRRNILKGLAQQKLLARAIQSTDDISINAKTATIT